MKSLQSRLKGLERRSQRRSEAKPRIRVLFADESQDCDQHAGCVIDRETGEHTTNVIRLSFGGRT
jgi:hypothetical protein